MQKNNLFMWCAIHSPLTKKNATMYHSEMVNPSERANNAYILFRFLFQLWTFRASQLLREIGFEKF